MNKQLLLAACCILISLQSFAARLSGIVTDAANGTPLQGVLVVIKENNKTAETDEAGKYEFENVDNGTYEVIFNLLTYKKVLQTVTVISNKGVVLNIKMKSEGNALKDVTVNAARTTNTENAVLMEIRKSNMVVSGISAAQISKTMDRNAADVVKRVPGVSILDNRFIMVRGLYDRYNTVWLNDAGAPSAEVDKKSFSFDLLPAGVIDRILIFKTPAPELPGDFAGGAVKIYTSSLPSKNQVMFSVQSSYRDNSTGKTFYYNQPSSTDWLGYDDGKRELPANTPAYINKNDFTNSAFTKSLGKDDWIIKTMKAKPDLRVNFMAANVLNLKKLKLGNTLAVSYTNTSQIFGIHRQAHDSVDLDYNYSDIQSVNNVNACVMDNLVAVVGNSKFEFKNLYNQVGRSSVTERNTINDTSVKFPAQRSYVLAYESRAVYCAQLAGTHKTKNDNTRYNWTLGYTDLFKNMPDLRRIRYSKQQMDDDSMYRAQIANQVDPVFGGGRLFSTIYENLYSFNHQLTQKLRLWNYEFEASAGNYVEYRKRSYNMRQLGYTIRPGQLANNLTRLPINQIFADSNVGDKTKFRIDEATNSYDKYDAKNTMIASFVSLNLPIGEKIKVTGGVRYENNSQYIHGYISVDTITAKVITKFWLPSVNAAYYFTEKSLVRVAYGKTLNRPEFREAAPTYYYDFDEAAGLYGSLYTTALRDTLKVAQIQNVDARWEWYPAEGEMVHAGVFYKSFKDPIQKVVVNGGSDSRAYTLINTTKAYSAGLEIEFRKNLIKLDDWMNTNIFKDFTLTGNATFIKSEMVIGDTVTKQQLSKVPLQGQSPYMFNAGLFYQNDNIGLQGTLVYNVFGPRLIALGTVSNANVGEMPFHSLDFLVSKMFFKHYIFTAGVQNILDSKVMTVEDIDRNGKFETKGKALDTEFTGFRPGRYYSIGIKVRF